MLHNISFICRSVSKSHVIFSGNGNVTGREIPPMAHAISPRLHAVSSIHNLGNRLHAVSSIHNLRNKLYAVSSIHNLRNRLHAVSSIHNLENRLDAAATLLAKRHPFLFYLCIFIGMPLFTLAAVFLASSAILLPVAWLSGWL